MPTGRSLTIGASRLPKLLQPPVDAEQASELLNEFAEIAQLADELLRELADAAAFFDANAVARRVLPRRNARGG